MSQDASALIISATKPRGKPAKMLAEMGITVVPVEEDEGNVDRYILSKRLAIERRTGSGFLVGITDKTLFTSAIYLREHFRLPVLIVEGSLESAYRAFDPRAIRGALSSMMLQYAINVLCTPTVEETVALVAMMTRQEQVGIPEISLVPKRKATDLADMQRRVVEMLPGCGMVLARDLLQHFGGVKPIMNASADEFRELKGIGARKAAEMHKVLNAEYGAVDTERNLEDAIAESPDLLFAEPATLLARQHHIYTEGKERHVVDMVFLTTDSGEVILVELKRGRLAREHEDQLRRYLDHAPESPLLCSFLDNGAALRGVLATTEPNDFKPKSPDVGTRIVDSKRTIEVLKRLRARRLNAASPVGEATRKRKGR